MKTEESKKTKKAVRRKRSSADYSSLFLRRNELKVRSCVYISQRVHATISEIHDIFFTSASSIASVVFLFRGLYGVGFRTVKVFSKNTLAQRERGRFFEKQSLTLTVRQESANTFAL